MSVDEIHVGDIGTVFEITIMDGTNVVDVSSATTQEFIFQKPNKATVTKTTGFKTDGTDGIIDYTTVTNDLDMSGTWFLQAHLVLSTGTWRTDVAKFVVYDNL